MRVCGDGFVELVAVGGDERVVKDGGGCGGCKGTDGKVVAQSLAGVADGSKVIKMT